MVSKRSDGRELVERREDYLGLPMPNLGFSMSNLGLLVLERVVEKKKERSYQKRKG